MCDSPILKNDHPGNTYSEIKYALHCDTSEIMEKTIKILEAMGFRIRHQEIDAIRHTFLTAPRQLVSAGSFHYAVVLKAGGNRQTLIDGNVQSVHLGFRTSPSHMERIQKSVCALTNTRLITKPDESSLFIELPCGEVVEIVGRAHDAKFPIFKTAASILILGAIWMR